MLLPLFDCIFGMHVLKITTGKQLTEFTTYYVNTMTDRSKTIHLAVIINPLQTKRLFAFLAEYIKIINRFS